jgi:hypothetical protein
MQAQLTVTQSETWRPLARCLKQTLSHWSAAACLIAAVAAPAVVHAQTAPAAPVLKVFSNTVDLVALSWAVPPGTESQRVELMASGPYTATSGTKSVSLGATAASAIELGPNVTQANFAVNCAPHSFRVFAKNAAGSTSSNVVTTTCPCTAPPASPTTITLTKVTMYCSAGARFKFTSPSQDTACVSSYSLFDGTSLVGTFGRNQASPTVTSLVSGVAHSYAVKAVNLWGTSPASPAVAFTCKDGVPPVVVSSDAGSAWAPTGYQATDIAVGGGKVWFINGQTIYQVTASGPQAVAGAATRIAVDPKGVPWVVNAGGSIFKWSGTAWTLMPGQASDIGIGVGGGVWIIAKADGVPSLWNGTDRFVPAGGAGTRISVGVDGTPFIVNAAGEVYKMNTSRVWGLLPITNASDISVGPGGEAYVVAKNGAIFRNMAGTWVNEAGISGTVVAAGIGTRAWLARAGAPVLLRN